MGRTTVQLLRLQLEHRQNETEINAHQLSYGSTKYRLGNRREQRQKERHMMNGKQELIAAITAHSSKSLFRYLSEYLKRAYKGLQHSYDSAFVKSSGGKDKTLVPCLYEHEDLLGVL